MKKEDKRFIIKQIKPEGAYRGDVLHINPVQVRGALHSSYIKGVHSVELVELCIIFALIFKVLGLIHTCMHVT